MAKLTDLSFPRKYVSVSSLSPADRANAESICRAVGVRTQPLLKEGLEKSINFGDKNCTWTILESTSTRAKGNVSCQGTGMTMSGNGEFEAPDPEHVRGFAHMTSNEGGNKVAIDSNFTWKWLASSCGNTQ
ncbi:MAG TPA: hypothetical protein VJQ82_28170 [Terriglobales bacterium]|nr:hypothetical protein [Terriglobales bacterium]